ncbi:MAG: amino acid ABC transporter ATP-binding protein [Clostridium sp.]|uniref:amino acid ABC transporter ATP-binding protein n=1 Tax=Clostridium sp. TaxID=1506 RepID=UPI001EC1C6D3|nr:amino acid ABC transporter ATP-binding protein [Clostridium sp.]MBS5885082.1 amino acid ABC transporter ATP-binding protein [Clostridium sp.]MDU7148578.1 amino acid ABC transporter ATP-binding protein [Clostridium sp.]MDU7241867.1 amino acid ABC transporter ATP-binding protein [Clostridium sp.]
MLKIQGLRKNFGKSEVLKGIDLEVKNGEIAVIVGPSGGGKTTLLRCVNGLEFCDEGTIEIDNKFLCKEGVYKEKKEFNEARREIGLVFQNFNLFPHMSVLENLIEAPKRVLGESDELAKKNATEILGFLELKDKLNSYPYELSGGQKQRVAIGRALALNPKLMCFDEPTSALDPGLTGEVASLIKSLAKDGMSMLIITHDMIFAEKVADKIYSMDNGKLKEGNIF